MKDLKLPKCHLSAGLGAGSDFVSCSSVGILSFFRNILLLKLLRTFSLAPRHNRMRFRKDLFLNYFYTFMYTI